MPGVSLILGMPAAVSRVARSGGLEGPTNQRNGTPASPKKAFASAIPSSARDPSANRARFTAFTTRAGSPLRLIRTSARSRTVPPTPRA